MPRRLLLLTLFVLGFFLAPRSARAAGSVTLATREPVEADGKWKLVMNIDYGSVPHLPHIPVLVVFTPTVHYDLSLTDKSPEKPVLTKIPLQNQQPINEGLDVGFADASGKVFKGTKLDFVIRRDHGFEAGEYELKLKREDDGVQIGQTMKLVLKGDNPVVDRRAIVFAGDKKSKKDAPKDDDKKADDKKADAPKENETPLENAEPKPDDSAPAPPPVEPKQGGCGCVVAGDTSPSSGAALAALGLVAIGVRRRRARRTA